MCRHCAAPLSLQMVDLGASPPSNAFNVSQNTREKHYPLRVLVCMQCGLAQTDITLFKLNHDELFTKDYPYYSSTSVEYVEHARRYVEKMTHALKLDHASLTVEVGSNDGYLLQFVKTPCYGIEPTATCEKSRVPIITYTSFFSEKMARWLAEKGRADLMICNNVLAHVPDINDFARGFAALMKPQGVATFEFPWLANLIDKCQFDTIYHEHYSYLSLTAVISIFKRAHLSVFGCEKLATHGGSLRVYVQHEGAGRKLDDSVVWTLAEEMLLGQAKTYADFQHRADDIKNDLLYFLLHAKRDLRSVAGFGAAAKANTLLNYAGIRSDLIPYIVDETVAKRGKFCPGSRIPVRGNFDGAPDYIIIFPWNFRDEIIAKLAPLRERGSSLVFAIPQLEVIEAAHAIHDRHEAAHA